MAAVISSASPQKEQPNDGAPFFRDEADFMQA
jgi:hypothetical protein